MTCTYGWPFFKVFIIKYIINIIMSIDFLKDRF